MLEYLFYLHVLQQHKCFNQPIQQNQTYPVFEEILFCVNQHEDDFEM